MASERRGAPRRRRALAGAAALVTVVAGCGGGGGPLGDDPGHVPAYYEELRARGESSAGHTAANDWTQVRESFGASLRSELTDRELQAMWRRAVEATGPFVHRGASTATTGGRFLTDVQIEMGFARGTAPLRLTMTRDGIVTRYSLVVT